MTEMIAKCQFIWCVLLILVVNKVVTFNSCETQQTCHGCIMDPNICVWCKKDNFTRSRCKPADSYDKTWCSEIENPPYVCNIDKDLDFGSKRGHIIQIKPQKYKIKLRPGQKVDYKFTFNGVKDYPVDLYFLLDASHSMEAIKEKTESESENIYKALSEITKDMFLGLGNFIDKNALPYNHIKEIPFIQGAVDNDTYSFRNRLKLIDSLDNFKRALNDMKFGQNYDTPEGGLDALAQVIVCKDEIGWRNESRKIVVFMTDAFYHAAGDGKTAGIFQPYDGKCYTEQGIYTKEIEMDYPSVGMINKLAMDEEVIIIFAVPTSITSAYKKLSQAIGGSHHSTFDDTSGRITAILKDIYEKITRTIKLKVNMNSEDRPYFKFTFDPDCSKVNDNNNNCSVEIDKHKSFTGTIQLLDYYGKDNIEVNIAVEGIMEKLVLDIDVIKTCNCEESAENINSMYCNGGGTLQCGICKCNEDRYGDKCICTKSKHMVKADNSTCIADDGSELCSGHGTCFCGTCKCSNRYEGQYCECNKDSCPRDSTGSLCSSHGTCECGTCKCQPEWLGPKCDCYTSLSPCTEDGTVCNNRGECRCGSCDCRPIAKWDARNVQSKLCKMTTCPDCHDRQCRLLEECAICHHRQKSNCSEVCSNEMIINTTKSVNETSENNSWNLCSNIRIDVGCYTRFLYQYDDSRNEIKLLVQTDKDCLESYYLFGGISLAILILIGLATLIIWKILTDTRDRAEYERFVKEHASDLSGHSTNPIYEPATTVYHNPAFGRSFKQH